MWMIDIYDQGTMVMETLPINAWSGRPLNEQCYGNFLISHFGEVDIPTYLKRGTKLFSFYGYENWGSN